MVGVHTRTLNRRHKGYTTILCKNMVEGQQLMNFEEPLHARIELETKWVEFEKNLIELVDKGYFVFCR